MLLKFFYKVRKSVSYVVEYLRRFYSTSIHLSREELEFSDYLQGLKNEYQYKDINDQSIILVPLTNHVGTMRIILKLAYKLALEKELNIRFFYVHAAVDTKIERSNILSFKLQQFQLHNKFLIKKLCRIYGIKSAHLIISNFTNVSYKPTVHPKFKSKKEVLEFFYGGIRVGELIYDTYLRFRSRCTVDLSDPCLYDIVEYSKIMIEMWKKELDKYSIKTLLLPYVAYHHWGIPAYICLNKRIEVLTYGSNSYVLSALSIEHPYHSKNFHRYRELFKTIRNPSDKKQLAEEILNKRLGGQIDLGTSYMKTSAFDANDSERFSPGNHPWCVIFLHCFFDSPHIYGESLFLDFYEWLNHILNKAKELPLQNFYIKEHPNALPENKPIVSLIKEKYRVYTNIIFLSAEVSNKKIIEEKPAAIFTVYGTVAHEFASLGIPVVVA